MFDLSDPFRGPPIGDSGKGSRRFCPILRRFWPIFAGVLQTLENKVPILFNFAPILSDLAFLQIRQNQRVPFGPTPFRNSRPFLTPLWLFRDSFRFLFGLSGPEVPSTPVASQQDCNCRHVRQVHVILHLENSWSSNQTPKLRVRGCLLP